MTQQLCLNFRTQAHPLVFIPGSPGVPSLNRNQPRTSLRNLNHKIFPFSNFPTFGPLCQNNINFGKKKLVIFFISRVNRRSFSSKRRRIDSNVEFNLHFGTETLEKGGLVS